MDSFLRRIRICYQNKPEKPSRSLKLKDIDVDHFWWGFSGNFDFGWGDGGAPFFILFFPGNHSKVSKKIRRAGARGVLGVAGLTVHPPLLSPPGGQTGSRQTPSNPGAGFLGLLGSHFLPRSGATYCCLLLPWFPARFWRHFWCVFGANLVSKIDQNRPKIQLRLPTLFWHHF